MDIKNASPEDLIQEIKNRVSESLTILDEMVEAGRLNGDSTELCFQISESVADGIQRRLITPE